MKCQRLLCSDLESIGVRRLSRQVIPFGFSHNFGTAKNMPGYQSPYEIGELLAWGANFYTPPAVSEPYMSPALVAHGERVGTKPPAHADPGGLDWQESADLLPGTTLWGAGVGDKKACHGMVHENRIWILTSSIIS